MKITYFFKRFYKKEFVWRKLWFKENFPTKFASTAWFHNQKPFLIYRVLVAVYCVAIVVWKMSTETNRTPDDTAAWLLSIPTWGLIMMTTYNILALLCTSFNFDHDCLCNDDLRWYHKVSWILHELSFNATTLSFAGSMLYFLCRATDSESGKLVTEPFKSDDVIFYLLNPMLMSIDVFVVSISIRFLHFIYASCLFVLYDLIHVYRWVSGNKPSHAIFNFGNLPPLTSVMFFLIAFCLVVPFIHLIAYGIDSLRTTLITKVRARNRHEILRTANSSTSPKVPSTAVRKNESSLRYKTSAFQVQRPVYLTSSHKNSRISRRADFVNAAKIDKQSTTPGEQSRRTMTTAL